MSALQHTPQHAALRPRLALVVLVAGAAIALTVALMVSNGGRSDSLGIPSGAQSHPTHAQIERQLEAVAGPRYGLPRPTANSSARPRPLSPERQLQAVAGPRYDQRLWIHAPR